MALALVLLLLLSVVVAFRIYVAFTPRQRSAPKARPAETCGLAVFLGSGGHTSEALSLLHSLDFSRYTPRTYFVGVGDPLSVQKVTALELLKTGTLPESTVTNPAAQHRVLTIPRARRVHQNLLTTPFSALYSLLVSAYHVTVAPFLCRSRGPATRFDVLLLNGPGTCFVLCLAVLLNRVLGLPSPRVIYVESFARVKSLSLTGKLIRPFVDSFVVQWPDLLDDGRRGSCYGWLV
ncbi:glycosyltransferase family 1 protein [Auriscalpium vulgare]|uniref:Glycosyltransferase family 1 protein n=1 Tax=Auriscalpium vulgare TaxID=40419 RepID=A0ACB8RVC9_9AGAM|nr:glycosyltransferase family 1 protein [Auriscalpium vulgare]